MAETICAKQTGNATCVLPWLHKGRCQPVDLEHTPFEKLRNLAKKS